ncbi:hypothetical protein F5887DRAFT_1076007 [Amanita rubescens]|nr:hypothetical protein F5887DRAFT_1076007 [Amanita rubescens]
MADSITRSYNRNPSGKNQYSPCGVFLTTLFPSELNYGFAIVATIDDPLLAEALEKYHREKLDNNRLISQRLKADYGIEMGASTVKRRRRALGFLGSRSTMKTIDLAKAEQLVIAHMDADSLKPASAQTIQHRIAHEESIHLPRDFITKVIYAHLDQDKSETREPASKQVDRGAKRPARPSPTINDEASEDAKLESFFKP